MEVDFSKSFSSFYSLLENILEDVRYSEEFASQLNPAEKRKDVAFLEEISSQYTMTAVSTFLWEIIEESWEAVKIDTDEEI